MINRTPPRRRARKEKFCKDFGRGFMLAAFEVGTERARAKKAQARAAKEAGGQANLPKCCAREESNHDEKN